RESHFSAYLILWFPLLIWWTPLCLIRQILTRRFRLYAYGETNIMATIQIGDLACTDEDMLGEAWLAGMLIAAEIISIEPAGTLS
ncbi:TPA: hypothetical protein ACWXHU_001029, partial [Escherichia coli]